MTLERIEQLEKSVASLSRDLSIIKQLLDKNTRTEPTGAVAIADLPAASAEELAENPQLIFEHATGTKRGYLSQLFEQMPDLEVTDIPVANNSSTEGTGFGGFRYTADGSTLNLFTS